MMTDNINRVLLTGPPGIGKTTIIQEVCNLMKTKNVHTLGFYTKEVRNANRKRIGFDIITLDGRNGILARTKEANQLSTNKHIIGNYAVFVDEFESLVVPLLKTQKNDAIFIIDEIRKMELFSQSFENTVKKLFDAPNTKIIATIPVAKNKPIPLIEKLKSQPSTIMITVDPSNRDDIPAKILNILNI